MDKQVARGKKDKSRREQCYFSNVSLRTDFFSHELLECSNFSKFGTDITHSATLHHKFFWKFLIFFTILNNFTVHGWEHLDLGAQTPRPVGDIENSVVLSFVFVMLSPANGTRSNFGLNEKEISQDIYAAT